MNTTRKLLRIWLTISSFVGLLFGWIFLSHTADVKSVTATSNTTIQLPALQAIPTVQGVTLNSASNNVQTFTVNPSTSQSSSFSPQLRTGGS